MPEEEPTRTPAEQNERNRLLAEEFRKNGGVVGEARFATTPLLLLTTRGRRSGRSYLNPVAYLKDGDRYVVFASYQGAPEHPDWFENLMAYPETTIEVGTETLSVRAVVLEGAERDALWARQVAAHPRFGDYATRTSRVIPVVALEPVRAS